MLRGRHQKCFEIEIARLSKIVALAIEADLGYQPQIGEVSTEGYLLKVIALALSEKEGCGWNTSFED